MRFPKLNTKQWTLVVLIALAVVHVARYTPGGTLPMFTAALVATLATDTIAEFFKKRRFIVTSGAAITGVLIGSILAPGTSPLLAAGLAVGSMLAKHLVRLNNRPVFNPAALALFVGAAFFGVRLAWWAGSEDLLTIIAGSFILALYPGHWRLIAAFTGGSLFFATIQALILGRPVLNVMSAMVLYQTYFVFFMLTDPRTSPIMPRSLSIFGFLASLGVFLSYFSFPASTLLSGLLFANVGAVLLNWRDLAVLAARAPVRAAPVVAAGAAAMATAMPVVAAAPPLKPWSRHRYLILSGIAVLAMSFVAGAVITSEWLREGDDSLPGFRNVSPSAVVRPVGDVVSPSAVPAPTDGTVVEPAAPVMIAPAPKPYTGEKYSATGLLIKRNPDRVARDLALEVRENGQKVQLTLQFMSASWCQLEDEPVTCGRFRLEGAAFGTVEGWRTGNVVKVDRLQIVGGGDDEEEEEWDD